MNPKTLVALIVIAMTLALSACSDGQVSSSTSAPVSPPTTSGASLVELPAGLKATVATVTIDGELIASNQLIVGFGIGTTAARMKEIVAAAGGEIIGDLPSMLYVQTKFAGEWARSDIIKIQQILAGYAEVEQVRVIPQALVSNAIKHPTEEDAVYKALWDGDFTTGDNWHIKAAKFDLAWDLLYFGGRTLSNVSIGIVDNYFEQHPDLDSISIVDPEVPPGQADFPAHGMNVAGIIGATGDNSIGITGVAWNNRSLVAYDGSWLSGVAFQEALGKLASGALSVDVMNISAGDKKWRKEDGTLQSNYTGDRISKIEYWRCVALHDLRNAVRLNPRLMVVESAGNDWIDAAVNGPAPALMSDEGNLECGHSRIKYLNWFKTTVIDAAELRMLRDHVVVVAASYASAKSSLDAASYSNFGPTVTVWAPGGKLSHKCDAPDALAVDCIYSLGLSSGYSRMAGTSQAAPHVTGLIASLWQINPNLTSGQIKNLLTQKSIAGIPVEPVVTIKDQVGVSTPVLDAYKAVVEAAKGVSRKPIAKLNSSTMSVSPSEAVLVSGTDSYGQDGNSIAAYTFLVLDPVNRLMDRKTGSDKSYSRKFEAPGKYTIQLFVTDSLGLISDKASIEIMVKDSSGKAPEQVAIPVAPAGALSPGATTAPGALLSSATVGLSWNPATGATSYRVRVTEVASGAVVVDTNVAGAQSSVDLLGGKTYKWRVAACSISGCSAYAEPAFFTIKTGISTPSSPANLSPGADSAPGVILSASTSVTLTWAPVTGATSYTIGLLDLSSNLLSTFTTTKTARTVADLVIGRGYSWNVAACNSSGCSLYSNAVYFTNGGDTVALPKLDGVTPSTVDAGATKPYSPVLNLAGLNLDKVTAIKWLQQGALVSTWTKQSNGSWISSSGTTQSVGQTSTSLSVQPTVVASADTWTGIRTWTVSVASGAAESSSSFTVSRTESAGAPIVSAASVDVSNAATGFQDVVISGSGFAAANWHQFSVNNGAWSDAASAPFNITANSITVAVAKSLVVGTTVRIRVCAAQNSNEASCSNGVITATIIAPVVSSIVVSSISPSVFSSTTLPYDASIGVIGSNLTNVNRVDFTWTGPSGPGSDTWNRGDASWVARVSGITTSGMTISPRVLAFSGETAGTANWTLTFRDVNGTAVAKTFSVTYSPPTVPTPVISSLSPTTMVANGAAQSLAIIGNSFQAGNWVQYRFGTGAWTNFSVAPTISSASLMTVSLNPGTTADTIYIRVCTNSAATNCSANTPSVSVAPAVPTPVVASLNPTTMVANGTPQSLAITGSSFQAGNWVQYRFGTGTWTNFSVAPAISSASLMTVSLNPGTTADTIYIRVCTSSAATNCSVNTPSVSVAPAVPTPVVASLNPTTMVANGVAQSLAITGSGFQAGNWVQYRFGAGAWTNFSVAPTISSANLMTVSLNPGTTADTIYIRVCTTSAATNCSVNTPGVSVAPAVPTPVVASLNPTTMVANGVAQSLAITGNSFQAGNWVQYRFGTGAWTNFSVAPTISSANLMTVSLNPGTTADTIYIRVCKTLAATNCSVNTPAVLVAPAVVTPAVASVSPTAMVANGILQTVAITGSNFSSGNVVQYKFGVGTGAGVWTTSSQTPTISTSQITIALNPGSVADTINLRVCRSSSAATTADCSSGTQSVVVAPTAPPLPVVSSVSPTSMAGNGVLQSVVLTGSNFRSENWVQYKIDAGAWKNWSEAPAIFSSTQLSINVVVTLSPGTTSATIYFRVCRSSTANADIDCSAIGQSGLTQPLADLKPSTMTLNGSSDGYTMSVGGYVSNVGGAPAPETVARFQIVNSAGLIVKFQDISIPALKPSEYITLAGSISMAGMPSGSYKAVVVVDINKVVVQGDYTNDQSNEMPFTR